MFGTLVRPGVCEPARHAHTNTSTHTRVPNYPNKKRYMSFHSVFYRSPGCRMWVCSQLISTVEPANISQRDGSKWCVIACSILRPLLRNVSEEFTAPNGDASAPCVFQLWKHWNSTSPPILLNYEQGPELWSPLICLTVEQVLLGF